ncbi:prenyltransferase [Methanomicrobiaceae archaeon CYW5]|uniref:UbiA family prenyltransferase n=1 Tax=Methanovulcanius yangii TaxID=1789227 RepID=UPI0029CA3A6D|nr:UbiA family prenyltransferase [Methanovulcanius yangii]MBT8508263.1 prenyltransferase [Methanovulcanius yangii]
MTFGAGIPVRAMFELIRLDLAFGAGFFLVAGQILAIGGVPPFEMALAGFIMLFCISGSANISNDYFDREVDRVNRPDRPLPSGRITPRGLWMLFVACTVVGFAAAAFISLPVLVLGVVLWGLSLLYNVKIKEYGLAGNLVVAFCVGMTIVTGGITMGMVTGPVLLFGILAFLFDLGEEIAADAMDVTGDQLRPSRSLAKVKGRKVAITTAAAVFGVFYILTLVPVVMGWFGYEYLLLAAVIDLWMIWCTIQLLRDRSIEEGHRQVRRLYLAWGAFVIVLVVSGILLPMV